MKSKDFTKELDITNLNGSILSTEDKILLTLLTEKGCTKGELSKHTNIVYSEVKRVIEEMEVKGYVVQRQINETIFLYYLTMPGAYEVQDRLNTDTVKMYRNYLVSVGFSYDNVIKFLKRKFYDFYIAGVWNPTDLEDQYKTWCDSNNLEYVNSDDYTLKLY